MEGEESSLPAVRCIAWLDSMRGSYPCNVLKNLLVLCISVIRVAFANVCIIEKMPNMMRKFQLRESRGENRLHVMSLVGPVSHVLFASERKVHQAFKLAC